MGGRDGRGEGGRTGEREDGRERGRERERTGEREDGRERGRERERTGERRAREGEHQHEKSVYYADWFDEIKMSLRIVLILLINYLYILTCFSKCKIVIAHNHAID